MGTASLHASLTVPLCFPTSGPLPGSSWHLPGKLTHCLPTHLSRPLPSPVCWVSVSLLWELSQLCDPVCILFLLGHRHLCRGLVGMNGRVHGRAGYSPVPWKTLDGPSPPLSTQGVAAGLGKAGPPEKGQVWSQSSPPGRFEAQKAAHLRAPAMGERSPWTVGAEEDRMNPRARQS